jgi:hypothetical protein
VGWPLHVCHLLLLVHHNKGVHVRQLISLDFE